ncbi:MAG: flagellar hook capping protein [Lachnospiraceae bacterium]|nr:flagellar hook capping protein [Lachnospiraceae bacterium]
MPLIQSVEDGKIVNPTGSQKVEEKKAKDATYDTEMFLKLLVAEMQYQDPLEPTQNTEWVSQMATFSQVEEMQTMESEVQSMQAAGLVGQYVVLKTVDSTGNTNYVSGTVDFIKYEEGKAFLSVNDNLYSIEDLERVAEKGYVDAVSQADTFVKAVGNLPAMNVLTLQDEDKLIAVREALDSMNDYTKQFIPQSSVEAFEKLEDRMKALKILAGITDNVNSEAEEATE